MSATALRRRLARAALAAVGVAGVAAPVTLAATSAEVQRLHTRTDLTPPRVEITVPTGAHPDDGLIFIAPKIGPFQYGPMILDNSGRTVWFHPVPAGLQALDFKPQTYDGKPVVTWWQGHVELPGSLRKDAAFGTGEGEDVIFDQHYRQVARVRAGNGLQADLHEFELTPQNTALITAYRTEKADLSSLGASKHGLISDSYLQEVDVRTGKVLFQWRSLDHVPLADSYIPPAKLPKGLVFDYFHINSVKLAPDGSLIVSARNTSTIYDIDRHTGKIIWQLGGKHSSFAMRPGTRFAFQHDANLSPDGTLTLFDDSSPPINGPGRGLVLRLHFDAAGHPVSAERVADYQRGTVERVGSQGSMQLLPNGHVFVGFGDVRYFDEFDAAGHVVLEGKLPKKAQSYRAYRGTWHGYPRRSPVAALRRLSGGKTEVYASWNGATAVAQWEVLAGPDAAHLRRVAKSAATALETPIVANTTEPYFAVRALSRTGRAIGKSVLVP